MKRIGMPRMTTFAATVAAMLFLAGVPPRIADAQENPRYASDTITVVTNSENHMRLEVSGKGRRCLATTSADRGVGISIGDDLCEVWDGSDSTPSSLYARISPTTISFRQAGKTYQITDASTVKRARDMFGPIEDFAQQQMELGEQQREMGEKQRGLGEQQREVKIPVPDMSADFAKVEADAKRLSAQGGTASELGDLQSELGDLQSRLGDLQSQAGDVQSKLGDQQSVLGDQQSALANKQSALGDREGQLADQVARRLKSLLDQSLNSGTAKPE
jgi:bla regulator protein blaR1